MYKFTIVILLVLSFYRFVKAQPLPKNNYLSEINYDDNATLNTNILDNNNNQADLIIRSKIFELNYQTPIQLDYNEDVKKYINYFLNEKREWLVQCIQLSHYYFPIFESFLDKYQLPLELKYLAVIESGLNPFARSKSGAVGLWQFLYPTSQLLNLKVNSFIDERKDPYKSTEAACKYLEYLYHTFNDWLLAIAAYNGGPTVIKNAIIRSGEKTSFWEIRPYLSAETQNYVPAFIAIYYLFHYAKEYKLNTTSTFYLHQVDTIMIDKPLYLSVLSENLDVNIELLRFLNPQYKKDYIPKYNEPLSLVLPSNKILEFLKNSYKIYDLSFPQIEKPIRNKAIQYTVKKGDYLTKLAVEFRCSPEDIKKWNNLKSNELSTGSVLTIWIVEENLPVTNKF